LKFYASVRLDTRRKEVLPDNKGIRVKVKVVKNKVAPPFQVVMLDILFGSGIDGFGCMLDAAQDLGIIERRGSWYAYDGKQLAQGREKTVEYLKNNEVGLDIQEQVRSALLNFGKEPEEENEETPVDVTENVVPIEEDSIME
jgi:recombination protein RecA